MSAIKKHRDPLEWQRDALCAQVAPDLWFPELGSDGSAVKRLCAECPVRQACLQYALDLNVREGVWGGLGPAARRKLRAA